MALFAFDSSQQSRLSWTPLSNSSENALKSEGGSAVPMRQLTLTWKKAHFFLKGVHSLLLLPAWVFRAGGGTDI
jgi:hypothetical protein